MDENTYIPLLIFAGLLFSTYYFLGIRALSSNIFMLSIYTMFVPILFFTYGAYIEKQIVKDQVERLVDSFTSNVKVLGYTIPDVNIPVDKSLDDTVKKNNTDLLKRAFTVLTVGFAGGVALSVVLWRYAKERFEFMHMVYENLGLLLLVAITEVVFFGVISRNYRSLDSNAIKKYILEELAAKLK
jgi:hypothetical protein